MRASTGAVFTTRLVRASFAEIREWAQVHGLTMVGTAGDATEDYRTADYGTSTLVVMGSERAGLPPEYQAACDLMVSIPMRGRADSLNLAVATGLVLYEVLHHRDPSEHTESRSEEHTSEPQSLMRISYDVFCLKKKPNTKQ